MNARSRCTLVVLLSAAAAGLDAWSFFGLGQVFVANMTGNTVLLGFAVFAGPRARVWRAAVSLVCYVAGAFAGTLLARPIRRQLAAQQPDDAPQLRWPGRATAILAAECILVAACAWTGWRLHPAEGTPLACLLLAIVAVSVGLQSAMVNALRLPGVATTYITGTWTTFAAGFALLVDGEKEGAKHEPWTARLSLEAMVLAAYLASAVVCGLMYRCGGRSWMGLYPATLLVITVGGIALTRPRGIPVAP